MARMNMLKISVDSTGHQTKIGYWDGKVWGEKTYYFDGCVAVHLTQSEAMIREDRSNSSGKVIALKKDKYDALAAQIASDNDGFVGGVSVSHMSDDGFTLSKDGVVLSFDKNEKESYIYGIYTGDMLIAGLEKSQKEGEAIMAKKAA